MNSNVYFLNKINKKELKARKAEQLNTIKRELVLIRAELDYLKSQEREEILNNIPEHIGMYLKRR